MHTGHTLQRDFQHVQICSDHSWEVTLIHRGCISCEHQRWNQSKSLFHAHVNQCLLVGSGAVGTFSSSVLPSGSSKPPGQLRLQAGWLQTTLSFSPQEGTLTGGLWISSG